MSNDDIPIGTIIADRFRIIGKIGEGGMGVVFRVEHVATGAHHALKLLHGELARSVLVRERFAREAQVSARVASEHIVSVIDAGTDANGEMYLVMELLDGATLEDAMRAGGPMCAGVTLEIMEQMCHALAAAHAAGIFHRDIKPENIFLTRRRGVTIDVIVKLLDFGIAKMTAPGADPAQSTIQAGSIAWAPPEQWNPQLQPTSAIDVWPLGLIAFTMLTGCSYWESENDATSARAVGVLTEVLAAPMVLPSERVTAIGGAPGLLPPGFDAWFASCVERDPGKRCPGPMAALAGLRSILGASRPIPLARLATRSHDGPPSMTHRASTLDGGAHSAVPPGAVPLRRGARRNRARWRSRAAMGLAGVILLGATGFALLAKKLGFAGFSGVSAATSPALPHETYDGPGNAAGNAAGNAGLATREASHGGGAPGARARSWHRDGVLSEIRKRGVLRVAVENEAPPLNMGLGQAAAFVEGAGDWRGLDHDVVKAVASELARDLGLAALPLEVHAADLDTLPKLLESGQADVMMGGQIVRNSKEISWSDPYLDFGHCLVTRLGSDVRSLADLGAGRTVGIYKGDTMAAQFTREKLGSATAVLAEGTGWMAPLVDGTWDAVVYDFPFAVEELSEKSAASLRIVEMNLTESQYVIGMPADNPDFVRAINGALGRAFGRTRDKKNYAEIVRSYFGSGGRIADEQLPANRRFHVVKAGETLKSIAANELGDDKRVGELWNANKARFGSQLLVARGDKLLLPADLR